MKENRLMLVTALSALLILLHQPCLGRAETADGTHTVRRRPHAVQDDDASAYDDNVRQALYQNVNNRPQVLTRASAADEDRVSAAVTTDPRPIRIHFDYSNMSGEEDDAFTTALVEHVLPSAAAEIARRISVKEPVDGTLYILPTCVESFNNDRFRCTKVATTCNNLNIIEKYFSAYELCEGDSDDSCTTVSRERRRR